MKEKIYSLITNRKWEKAITLINDNPTYTGEKFLDEEDKEVSLLYFTLKKTRFNNFELIEAIINASLQLDSTVQEEIFHSAENNVLSHIIYSRPSLRSKKIINYLSSKNIQPKPNEIEEIFKLIFTGNNFNDNKFLDLTENLALWKVKYDMPQELMQVIGEKLAHQTKELHEILLSSLVSVLSHNSCEYIKNIYQNELTTIKELRTQEAQQPASTPSINEEELLAHNPPPMELEEENPTLLPQHMIDAIINRFNPTISLQLGDDKFILETPIINDTLSPDVNKIECSFGWQESFFKHPSCFIL